MHEFSDAILQEIFRGGKQSEQDKLKYFFDGLENGIVEDLNRLYQKDQGRYEFYLSNVKSEGYKVFRNSQGKHKVELK